MAPLVRGTTTPKFEAVKTAFIRNFTLRGEVGASVCIYHRGERVVDLWGGTTTLNAGSPWQANTLTTVFSATKGVTALCLLHLADRGHLDYDRPVAYYWPEFAQGDKGRISVRQLLNHRSGLSALDEPLTLGDLGDADRVSRALARQQPLWTPGTHQGYMATTFGLYAAEVFRRVTGTTVGRYLQEEVAKPLQADVFIGLSDQADRVAPVIPLRRRDVLARLLPRAALSPKVEGRVFRQMLRKSSDTRRAFANPSELGAGGIRNFNRAEVRELELCWANAQASARGLARLYAALSVGGSLDGIRLVGPSSVAQLKPRQSWGLDRVMRRKMGFSLGFLKDEAHIFSPEPTSFGHPGAGGSLGWCDPKNQLAIGYTMNRMDLHIRSPRALALCHAAYACIRS